MTREEALARYAATLDEIEMELLAQFQLMKEAFPAETLSKTLEAQDAMQKELVEKRAWLRAEVLRREQRLKQ